MTCSIAHTTVDARHAYTLSEWWKQLLGYTDIPGDPNLPEHPECMIQSPDGSHRVLFITVPDERVVKNRLHFDLRPHERTRDDEVEWAISIGATQVADHRGIHGPGSGWVILADPEGNEFCILRSQAELDAAQGTQQQEG
ncbi:MAG: VOC family protein [Nocardioidaceae bacterium]|nr:VOC family protein [Nocardioidaceae bacterium]